MYKPLSCTKYIAPPPPPSGVRQLTHSDHFDNFLGRLAFALISTFLCIDKWKRWTTLRVEKNYIYIHLSTKLACCIDIWKKCKGKSRFFSSSSHNLVQIWNAKPQSSEFHHWKISPSLPVPYNQIWELQSKLLGWLIHWIFANRSILGTANIRRKGQFLETMILRKRYCSFSLQFDNEELQKFVTRNLNFRWFRWLSVCYKRPANNIHCLHSYNLVGVQITKVFLYKVLSMDNTSALDRTSSS